MSYRTARDSDEVEVPFNLYNPPPDDESMWNVTVVKHDPLYKTGKIRTINLNSPKLFATQKFVSMNTIDRHESGEWVPSTKLPIVVRMSNGNMYIQDGHHRLSQLKFSGKKSAKAYVIDKPEDYEYKFENKKYSLKKLFFEGTETTEDIRVHHSKHQIENIKSRPKQYTGHKPIGFWYAVGDAWKEWAKYNYWPIGDYTYKVDLDMSKILVISNIEEMTKFNDEYGTKEKRVIGTWNIGNKEIRWGDVAKRYSGIEINPHVYEGKGKFSWYETWDIASGCVWDAAAVKDLVLLSKNKNDEEELDEEYLGSNGGLSYFQIGSSLPDNLYNRDAKGKPTRDPGVPNLTKKNSKKKRNKKKKKKRSLKEIFFTEAARAPSTLPEDVGISIEPYMGNTVVKYTENSSGVEGYVEMSLAKKGCLGAYIIFQSSATKGYGPLLYDVAIEIAGNHGVTADRGSVSSDASAVWEYYYKNRSDIAKKPLDDEDNPKTKPTEDDCSFDASRAAGSISFMSSTSSEVKRPWLNFVYYATSKKNFEALKSLNKLKIDSSLASESVQNKIGHRKNINENFNIYNETLRQNRHRNFEVCRQATKKIRRQKEKRLTDIFSEGPIMAVNRYRKDYSQGVEVNLLAINKPFYYATTKEYGSGDYIETPPGEQLVITTNSDTARRNSSEENTRIYHVQPIGDIDWIEKNDNNSLLTAPMLKVIDKNEEI